MFAKTCFSAGHKVHGRGTSICAFKGSRVDVPCPAANPNANVTWSSVYDNGTVEALRDFSADGGNATYKITEQSNTLTITSLNENNAKSYCCDKESSAGDACRHTETKLQVAGTVHKLPRVSRLCIH